MTPQHAARAWRLALVGGAFLLALALAYLRRDLAENNSFTWLFLPVILWAGYLAGLPGALTAAVGAGVATAVGQALGWLPGEAASALVVAIGLVFAFAAWLLVIYEQGRRARTNALLPEEAKLLQVERKARAIREQIEDYEQRLKSLAQLYESGKKLVGLLELGPLLDEARSLVAHALPQYFGPQAETESRLGFYIRNDDGRAFTRLESHGHEISDEGLPKVLELADLQRWSGDAFSPVRSRDLNHDPRFQPAAPFAAFHSLLLVPLVIQEILSGVMVVAAEPPDLFTTEDFNRSGVLGKQIVFALRKALLYREVQKLSITDNLTGLYVHRYFQERFAEELARAERYRHPLSLVIMDLDNFKRVNDESQGGHLTGDAVLAEAAARIRESAGAVAVAARYGGEEFALLLPNQVKARALNVAETVNAMLKATPIDVGGERLVITVSAGVASYPEDALSREDLIRAADSALYEAKRNGRDLVCAYSAHRHKEKNI